MPGPLLLMHADYHRKDLIFSIGKCYISKLNILISIIRHYMVYNRCENNRKVHNKV